MKSLSLKISVISFAIGLVLASCGGGKKHGLPTTADGKIDANAIVEQQLNESATQTDITASNWQSEVKKRFGIELVVPQGWSFSDVKTYWDGETVLVLFNRDADDATKPFDVAREIFNATQTISSDGNFNVDVNINDAGTSGTTSKGKVYENFEETQVGNIAFFGEDYVNAYWYYKKDGVKVISLDYDKGKKFIVKFEISKITI